jgi:hypothetical protein
MQVLFIAKCKYYLWKENGVELKPCQKGLVICGLAKTVARRNCAPTAETASTGDGLIQLGIAQPGSRSIRVRRRSGRSGVQHDERAGTGTGNTLSVDRVVPGKPALRRF